LGAQSRGSARKRQFASTAAVNDGVAAALIQKRPDSAEDLEVRFLPDAPDGDADQDGDGQSAAANKLVLRYYRKSYTRKSRTAAAKGKAKAAPAVEDPKDLSYKYLVPVVTGVRPSFVRGAAESWNIANGGPAAQVLIDLRDHKVEWVESHLLRLRFGIEKGRRRLVQL